MGTGCPQSDKPQKLKQARGFPAEDTICGSTNKAGIEQGGDIVPISLATAPCRHVPASEAASLSTLSGTSRKVPTQKCRTAKNCIQRIGPGYVISRIIRQDDCACRTRGQISD